MAITECGKGHVYDSEQYTTCPYCNTATSVIEFSAGGAEGKTISPGENPTPMPVIPFNDGDVGKTVAPDSYRKRDEENNKTVGIFKKEQNYDPVVGWLVCIDGPEKGSDYRLWARINVIGRSEKMDVCIKRDNTISKENHARLAYDPKHNNYKLIPADSKNNIYLNDEPVYIPVDIGPYDIIEIGISKMVFIPLCGERFNWIDGVKNPEK